MSEGSGRLQADPLFQGLARPAMVMGVSYYFFVINAVVCLVAFINTSNFITLFFVAPVVHGGGYLLCLKEPRAVELTIMHFSKVANKCVNRAFHGHTNSYDVF